MKSAICVFATVACLTLTSLTSVRADDAKPNNTEPWLPAQNQTVNCPQNSTNCTDSICHFNGASSDTQYKRFFADDESVITCGSLSVDIKFPPTKKSDFIGNKTYTCFKYVNGNGTTLDVALLVLNKPDDVKGSDVICTSNVNNCTLKNENTTQLTLTLVAGFQDNCAPWVPPETTTAAPTTPSATQSNANKTDEATTAGSHATVGNDTTTAAPVTPTPAPGVTTPSSGKGGKDDSSVPRLELATVLAMAMALFIRHCL